MDNIIIVDLNEGITNYDKINIIKDKFIKLKKRNIKNLVLSIVKKIGSINILDD